MLTADDVTQGIDTDYLSRRLGGDTAELVEHMYAFGRTPPFFEGQEVRVITRAGPVTLRVRTDRRDGGRYTAERYVALLDRANETWVIDLLGGTVRRHDDERAYYPPLPDHDVDRLVESYEEETGGSVDLKADSLALSPDQDDPLTTALAPYITSWVADRRLPWRARMSGPIELTVTLDGSNPPVYRKLHITQFFTLRDLHNLFQVVLGWKDCHLHEFHFGDLRVIEDEEHREDSGGLAAESDIVIGKIARPGMTFTYLYDMGDRWEHTVRIDRVHRGGFLLGGAGLLSGEGTCPSEDSRWRQDRLDADDEPDETSIVEDDLDCDWWVPPFDVDRYQAILHQWLRGKTRSEQWPARCGLMDPDRRWDDTDDGDW